MRLTVILLVLALAVAACGVQEVVPTPLSTAVPPSEDAGGDWAMGFLHTFPSGTFGDGQHRYRFLVHCPVFSQQDVNTKWYYFEVADQGQLSAEPVYLRLAGLSTDSLQPTALSSNLLHPDQELVAALHYVGLARSQADLAASGCEAMVLWDSLGRQPMTVVDTFQP